MSPRFDRRRDQGQGSGAGGSRSARPGRPARPAMGSARGGSRFQPRGEWRPEGEGRPRRPSAGSADTPRFGGGSRPERRGVDRPAFRRDEGSSSFRGRRPDRPASGSSSGPSDRPSFRDRPPFRDRPALRDRGSGRPSFRDRDRDRPRDRERPPVAIEVPTGEAERFNAGPADDLIWGRHAAQAALESERPIHRIWCTAEMRFQPRFMQLLREAKASGVLVEEVSWARLGQLTDGAVHQGIVLQAAAADTLDLDTLIDGCRSLGEPPLLMALDGITDPHNLGAIVRSAEALGAHGLVLPQRRSAGLTGSVAKVAAGALEHLPVARVVNLNRALDSLKQEGYRVIGLAGEGSISLGEADLDGPLVIVTGSEGSGLSMLTRKHCDQLVRIPLRGSTPSLNASVATAMVLYEVARRGWMQHMSGGAPAPRLVRPQLPAPAAVPAMSPAPPESDAAAAPPVDRPVDQDPADQHPSERPPGADTAAPLETPDLVLGLNTTVRDDFHGDIQL